jgi:hypothetical protein
VLWWNTKLRKGSLTQEPPTISLRNAGRIATGFGKYDGALDDAEKRVGQFDQLLDAFALDLEIFKEDLQRYG